VDPKIARFGRQVSLTLALTAVVAVMSALPWYEVKVGEPAQTPWALVPSAYVDRDQLGFLLSVLTVVALVVLGACAVLLVHYGEDGPGWAALGTAAATAAAVRRPPCSSRRPASTSSIRSVRVWSAHW